MEVGMKNYRQTLNPERSKIWTEPQSKQGPNVAVVYYLCRNRHLEQPHFIQVPLSSSSQGLYLKDFIDRLNAVRGKGMPSMYSWSCKRSYKNGFVWHDLCEDDLIDPTDGNEYVLKGSELLLHKPPRPRPCLPHSDRYQHSNNNNGKFQAPKQSRDASSSSSICIAKEKPQEEDETSSSTPSRLSSSTGVSQEEEEYNVYKTDSMVAPRAAHVSTQTRQKRTRPSPQTCIRGVSTDETEPSNGQHYSKDMELELSREEISPPSSSTSASSSGGKPETLESLIRADVKANSFRILEEENVRAANTKINKASNVVMQLISCGSLSVKDHSLGLLPTYKPRFSHVNRNPTDGSAFARFNTWPFLSNSIMLGELDCLSENPRLMGLRLEDKEYFSGSLIETKKKKQDDGGEGEGEGDVLPLPTLKRSSSYNADRNCKLSDRKGDSEEKEDDSVRVKCIPRTIKGSNKKPSKKEPLGSPVAERARNSSAGGIDRQQSISNRITTNATSDKRSAKIIEEGREKIIKIEERLSSGARVIIQSKAASDDNEGSTGS